MCLRRDRLDDAEQLETGMPRDERNVSCTPFAGGPLSGLAACQERLDQVVRHALEATRAPAARKRPNDGTFVAALRRLHPSRRASSLRERMPSFA